jgi:glycosyltransferase involved in cell wall biosynthesis
MKTILFVCNYREQVGGISGQVDILRNQLNNKLFRTSILNTKGNIFRRFVLFFTSISSFKKANVIHVHCCSNWGGFYPAILGIVVGRMTKKKVVLTYHGGDALYFIQKNKKVVLFILKKVDKLIVLSGFLKQVFEKFQLKTSVFPNIIETKKMQLNVKTDIQPLIISTRALNGLYNVDLIIDAFSEIKKTFPNATLTILGDGDQRKELEEKCKNQSILNVYFVGKVKNTDVNTYLKKNDIFISAPSIDNFPVSVLEAFENELLVIASDVGGVPFLVDHFKNGLLFQNKNVEDLVKMITFALNHKEQALNMIHFAKKDLEKYTWSENRHIIESIYNEL